MANMLVSSSSKSLIRTPTHTPANKPKLSQTPTTSFSLLRHLPTLSPPKSLTIKAAKYSPQSLKSLATAVAGSISLSYILPLPSLAEIEKAALFDFNLTLPIIAAEFLLLMVALDKIYYSPLGEFMDKRDATIKSKLAEVKDTSSEVKELEEQANAVMRAARAEIAAALNKMKKETAAEVEKLLEEGRGKVEAELEEALANLEKQKEETILALDSQIAALSDDIVKKVLPTLES